MGSEKSKFEIITQARIILDLPESATSDHIKKNFTQLIKKWHPDKNFSDPEQAAAKTREIIQAYTVIRQYCNQYEFSFSRQEADKYLSERERWIRQFGNDAVWPG